jgi:nitrogen regulation protein NR(I)
LTRRSRFLNQDSEPDMPTLLVIDDDRSIRHLVAAALGQGDLTVIDASTATDGLEQIRRSAPDVALLDILLPDMSGLELLSQIQREDPKLPVIFITSSGTSATAIEAMKLGAYDYVSKPLDVPHLKKLVEQALTNRRMMLVPVALAQTSDLSTPGDSLVGRSPQMQEVYKTIGRVAARDIAVLIRGESGTGKELVARAIYQHSLRADRTFLGINCAAIPEPLLESELFGHEKGAFTGAASRRIGKFEQSSGGTLFLDEVGDMSPVLQAKILRVLQEQSFERVGGTETIHTDVRVIAATHQNLEAMVERNEFRADLYYRLNGFTINLPPLRERHEDLCLLLEHLLARFSRELGKQVHGIAPDALQALLSYSWPGNVRELQSVVRQAILQASGPILVADALPELARPQPQGPRPLEPTSTRDDAHALRDFIDDRIREGSTSLYAECLERMERSLLTKVLDACSGNQSQASRTLGITRSSLRHKIRHLGIMIDQVVSVDEFHAVRQ